MLPSIIKSRFTILLAAAKASSLTPVFLAIFDRLSPGCVYSALPPKKLPNPDAKRYRNHQIKPLSANVARSPPLPKTFEPVNSVVKSPDHPRLSLYLKLLYL